MAKEVDGKNLGRGRMSEGGGISAVSDEELELEQAVVAEESSPQCDLSLTAQISALLFVSSKPLQLETIAEVTGSEPELVMAALELLRQAFTPSGFGVTLQEVAGGWQLRTAPEAREIVTRLIQPRGKRLSRAAAETLSVVAYKQPIQRADIESIRGVDALPTLKTLLDLRLIRVVGKAESPGHPVLYGTTGAFLERFGLKDLTDLPAVREIERLVSDPGESESAAVLPA